MFVRFLFKVDLLPDIDDIIIKEEIDLDNTEGLEDMEIMLLNSFYGSSVSGLCFFFYNFHSYIIVSTVVQLLSVEVMTTKLSSRKGLTVMTTHSIPRFFYFLFRFWVALQNCVTSDQIGCK